MHKLKQKRIIAKSAIILSLFANIKTGRL